MNDPWRTALQPRPRDPLAIDLDGDGIETTPVVVNGTPTLFDHDADGVRTGTGWLRPDDAWLVLDRNGNGTIDSGRELFGVDSLITVTQTGADGQPQTVTRNAANGFEALQTLDTGNGAAGSTGYGDRVFNASDAQFANVRVWRDLNQDGISQAGELQSLAAAGIASISLNPAAANTNLGNGNTVTGTAAVTRSNGGSTQVGSVSMQAGNLDLASNPFYRDFPSQVPLTAAAKSLPEMGGSGLLRDLREAMSLGTAESARLTSAVQAFASAPTRTTQRAALDELLLAWATTNPQTTAWVLGSATKTYSITSSSAFGAAFGAVLDVESPGWRSLLDTANGFIPTAPYYALSATDRQLVDLATSHGLITQFGLRSNPVAGGVYQPEWVAQGPSFQALDALSVDFRRIAVLQAFNGQDYLGQTGLRQEVTTWRGTNTTLNTPPAAVTTLMQQSYQALGDSVYTALALQTRLRPYLDAVDLVIDASGIRFDTTALNSLLSTKYANTPSAGMEDLVELVRFATPTLQAVGYDALATLRQWIEALPAGSPLLASLVALDVTYAVAMTGTAGSNVFLGDSSANTVDGGAGADLLDGGGGHDALFGGQGEDFIWGRAGNDKLYGDGMYGGAGGNDVLDGGAGNDQLVGGFGSDTYLFGRGDGQDTINNDSDGWAGVADPTGGKQDMLQFKAGILTSDLSLTRSGDSLVIKINGTTDQVTISNYFVGDGVTSRSWAVEQIRLNDGTTWRVADVKQMVLQATAGNDTLTGYATPDAINGMSGNDALYGRDGDDTLSGGDGADSLNGEIGNDVLLGGEGNDVLCGSVGNDTLTGDAGNDNLYGDGTYGGAGGNDVLDGGAGNDQLVGGFGSDTYLFGRGDGQDSLSNAADAWNGTPDPTVGKQDVLQFKAGVGASDVQLVRSGTNLIAKIIGTTDQVTINGYFNGDGVSTQGWAVDRLKFADGTSWDYAAVRARYSTNSAAAISLVQERAFGDESEVFSGESLAYPASGTDLAPIDWTNNQAQQVTQALASFTAPSSADLPPTMHTLPWRATDLLINAV